MLVLLLLLAAASDCQKVPPSKKIKVTLKQETDVSELVANLCCHLVLSLHDLGILAAAFLLLRLGKVVHDHAKVGAAGR